jgi:YegS/Rv2252/BmrU family lipid kinase
VLHPTQIEWDVSITHKFGDATRLAREAVERGVDLVAAYGGDGTQMEVANGLQGSGVPLAILPGGTGNAMAYELKIPLTLEQAIQLITGKSQVREIDLARIGEKIFMLRAYTGLDPDEAASREKKDRYGQLAYVAASVRFLENRKTAHYKITVDGEVIESDALICFILNAGALGGIFKHPIPEVLDVDISDGKLDLLLVTQGVKPFKAVSEYIFHTGSESDTEKTGVYHWQGSEIHVEADPPQALWIDGESYGKTPFTAVSLPLALRVVVPAAPQEKK